MTDELRDRVAEVLATHIQVGLFQDGGRLCAECGLIRGHAHEFEQHQADALLPLLAEAEARGVERGRAEVLNEAADALEGGLGVEGTPRNLYEFRQWLRVRAALTEERP